MASLATTRDCGNLRRFHRELIVAMLVYIAAAATVRWRSALPAFAPWLAVALAAILSGLAVRRYAIYLREADELARKVETEALAIGFGAGAIGAFLLPLLGRLGVPWLDEHAVALVMMIGWAAGSFFGNRRYWAREGE